MTSLGLRDQRQKTQLVELGDGQCRQDSMLNVVRMWIYSLDTSIKHLYPLFDLIVQGRERKQTEWLSIMLRKQLYNVHTF